MMKNFAGIGLLLLVCCGCYISTGADFVADITEDRRIDIPVDDIIVEDTLPDSIDITPPSCDTPPLEHVIAAEFLGDASPRVVGAAFYDPLRDRVVVYGGLRGSGDYTADAVAIELDTREIKLLGYEGSSPRGWTQAGTAIDREGDRVFVVGGWVVGDASSRVLEIRHIGDHALSASNLPGLPENPLRGSAAGYDPVGKRLVIVGGYDMSGSGYHNETWELIPDAPDPEWRLLADAGGPVAQENTMMVHVPSFGLVLLAKTTENYEGVRQLFVMQTGSEQWEEIPLDSPWDPGNRPVMFWDNDACRIITWGGGCTEGAHSIELFETPAKVTEISIDIDDLQPRVFLNATLDTKRRQVVIHGGYDCGVYNFLTGVETLSFD